MPKKSLVFAVCVAVIAVLSLFGWTNLKEVLFNGSGLFGIFLAAVLFLLAMAVFGIVVLIFDSWKMFLAAAGTIFLAYIFIFGFHLAYLAVFLAGLGLILIGIAEAKKEKEVHIKIMPSQIANPAQRTLFTVLAIAVSVVIYFSPPAQGLKTEIKIPRPLFDVILNSMTGFIDSQVQGLLQNPAGLTIPAMPQISAKNIQASAGANALRLDQFLTSKDRDNLYQALNQQMNFFVQPYKRYLPYGLVIAVFFSLKAIGFIFILLVGLLTKAIFSTLKSLKLVSVKKEMVERETIQISN